MTIFVTYKFKDKASCLHCITLHPEVFQVAQSKLVRIVLRVSSEQRVVHQRNGPELWNGLDGSSSFGV